MVSVSKDMQVNDESEQKHKDEWLERTRTSRWMVSVNKDMQMKPSRNDHKVTIMRTSVFLIRQRHENIFCH